MCFVLCRSLESFLSTGRCGVRHVTSVFAVFYFRLQLTFACPCFSSSVKSSWIHAITPTCFVLCQSLQFFLSTGRCGVSHITFVFAILYLLFRLSSACLCLSLSVKASSIRAITLTCFLLWRSLESFLSPGGCSFCYVPPVFAFFYLRLFLTSACLCFSLSVKPSWICAITRTCFVL